MSEEELENLHNEVQKLDIEVQQLNLEMAYLDMWIKIAEIHNEIFDNPLSTFNKVQELTNMLSSFEWKISPSIDDKHYNDLRDVIQEFWDLFFENLEKIRHCNLN